MQKLIYEAPEMEIVRFDTADIITSSGTSCAGVGPTECPSGGASWNGGGCSAGDGSGAGTGCDGSTSNNGDVD